MESLNSLLHSNRLFSVILDNAFDAIACYRPVYDNNNDIMDFEFLYLNDSALNTIYGKKEDYIGRRFLELFPYAAVDGMFDAFKKTALTGEAYEGIFYYEQGEYKGWYRDSVIKYGDGIIVYFRDVTSHKIMELELKQKNSELEKALKDKEILLQETHHRVKNNLQIVASLLNLQSGNIDNPEYLETCNTCKRRITTMAIIHQRLYEDKDFSYVNIGTFVTELINSLRNIYDNHKKIEFRCDIDNIDLSLNTSVNIGLMINELLTNSIKYAFTEVNEGEIIVQIKENQGIHIKISDNGKGLPSDFDLNKVQTLGMMLVKTFIEQMDGIVKIQTSPGTTFIIDIPLN